MNKQPEITSATKQKIIDAFLSLYKVKHIEKISIKEVTDLAGYNRGTFYVYFKDIYDLLEKIELSVLPSEEELGRLFDQTKKKPDASFPTLSVLNEAYSRNEKYYIVLLGENSNQHFYYKLKRVIKKALCSYLKANDSYNDSVETDYIIEYIVTALIGTSNYWLREKKQISFEELSGIQLKILTTSPQQLLFSQKEPQNNET